MAVLEYADQDLATLVMAAAAYTVDTPYYPGTPVGKLVAVDVADTGATATFTRAIGSWITDGLAVGDNVTVTVDGGTIDPGNAGTFAITAVSATVLTVTFASPVTIGQTGVTGTFTGSGSKTGVSELSRLKDVDLVMALSLEILVAAAGTISLCDSSGAIIPGRTYTIPATLVCPYSFKLFEPTGLPIRKVAGRGGVGIRASVNTLAFNLNYAKK